MPTVATLAMNPSIDVGLEVERVVPTDKLRCSAEQYDPGGGGVNVARVFDRLGGNALCYYLSGGVTGPTLESLLDRSGFAHQPIPIEGNTRICVNVAEGATDKDFRFVPAGPVVSESEWRRCLEVLENAGAEYVIASGSLPRGVPADFYARVTEIARRQGARMVLDSSGDALREGVAAGGFHLIKPSLAEFAQLLGSEPGGIEETGAAAMELIEQGKAEMIAVTMGEDGALLASAEGPRHLPAIRVDARSSAGAGDSFVAAMVRALSLGWEPIEAFRYGMAAGSAAVLTPGTDMCRLEDVERLFAQSNKS